MRVEEKGFFTLVDMVMRSAETWMCPGWRTFYFALADFNVCSVAHYSFLVCLVFLSVALTHTCRECDKRERIGSTKNPGIRLHPDLRTNVTCAISTSYALSAHGSHYLSILISSRHNQIMTFRSACEFQGLSSIKFLITALSLPRFRRAMRVPP